MGALVPGVFPYGPSLDFVDTGDIFERYVYQLGKSGWALTTTFSGGFLPLWGLLFAGALAVSARSLTP